MLQHAPTLTLALPASARHRRPLPSFRRLHDLDGYTPAAPSAAAAQEDREVCAAVVCPACRHTGLRYSPWTLFDRGRAIRYRAFAICPVCGHAEEF